MERGWWHRASRAEKLAQIDGAIELGMTVRQCAMNCGAVHPQTVGRFSAYHNRRFGWDHYRSKLSGEKIAVAYDKRATFGAAKEAYLSGEPVDFWSVE